MISSSTGTPLDHKIGVWTCSATGSISAFSSMALIYTIVQDRETKLKTPNNRFLLIMSIIDTVQSIGYAFSSFAVPKSSGLYGAIGNDTTCFIQGFVIQIGLIVPCYNACLCIWYLNSIKNNMSRDEFKRKIEPYCHAVSLSAPLILAVIIACLDKYAPRGDICWVGLDEGYQLLFVLLGGVFPFTSFLIIVYCLGSIHHSFLVQENKAKEFNTSLGGMTWQSNSKPNSKRKVAKQSLLFSFSFFITFFFSAINVLFFPSGKNSPFVVPQAFFMPLQGFWNFVIYAHPTLQRIRREYTDLNFWTALQKMVFHPEEVRSKSGRGRRRRRASSITRRNIAGTAGRSLDYHYQNNGESKQEEV